jgi:hypothetical protein
LKSRCHRRGFRFLPGRDGWQVLPGIILKLDRIEPPTGPLEDTEGKVLHKSPPLNDKKQAPGAVLGVIWFLSQ